MMAEADNHNDDVRVRWSVSLIRFLLGSAVVEL
jgi:hypothetical protein